MAWTNLFDLGECTVAVYDGAYNPPELVFSQIMEKGSTAQFENEYGDGPFTLSVSLDGKVSLDQWWFATVVLIGVLPSYPHDLEARVRSVVLGDPDGTGGTAGQAQAGINLDAGDYVPGVNGVQYTATDPATPEPMDLSALTGVRSGVFIIVSGGG